jgi:hypothetical protein
MNQLHDSIMEALNRADPTDPLPTDVLEMIVSFCLPVFLFLFLFLVLATKAALRWFFLCRPLLIWASGVSLLQLCLLLAMGSKPA